MLPHQGYRWCRLKIVLGQVQSPVGHLMLLVLCRKLRYRLQPVVVYLVGNCLSIDVSFPVYHISVVVWGTLSNALEKSKIPMSTCFPYKIDHHIKKEPQRYQIGCYFSANFLYTVGSVYGCENGTNVQRIVWVFAITWHPLSLVVTSSSSVNFM